MRILLISPANSDLISNVSLPLGLLSIGTYLKAAGHEVVITDMAVRHKPLKKILADFRPEICGISVRSSKSVRFAIDISAQIKKQLGTSVVVWGGPFCDNAPEKLFLIRALLIFSASVRVSLHGSKLLMLSAIKSLMMT